MIMMNLYPYTCTCEHTYSCVLCVCVFVFFKAEDGIRDLVRSRGLGDVYKRQAIHHELSLVTRNSRDFELPGLTVINPWISLR